MSSFLSGRADLLNGVKSRQKPSTSWVSHPLVLLKTTHDQAVACFGYCVLVNLMMIG